ncbi:MAG: tryptophan--tRNA ligase [Candidatus Dormibacteraeota bacterium]|nr:tryptophan--tRNA ligase [Candidatus Dormibacteraeota bacterium]
MTASEVRRPRVFSGIQPTGGLHLGNYLGAIRNWVRDLDRFDNIFCIVDLHALTSLPDPDEIRAKTLEVAALYVASGLDPSRCEIFVHSHVPAHTELGWIMECVTPMGWLERMTQFKARLQRQGRERIGTGVFTYPDLMTADILLYDADFVPVGGDQRQHIELARDVAQRLNGLRGEVVRVPEPLISDVGARVMGLDDPTIKMSKSVAVQRPMHAIFMLDEPDLIRRKVSRAQTDTEPAVLEPLGDGVANLVDIYAALHDISHDVALDHFRGKRYGELKGETADAIIDVLTPIQQRAAELLSDPESLQQQLRESSARAEAVAAATLDRVQEALGLLR